jgi:serine/threonine protein kinase
MGIILGTAAYMSPEQAVGRPVDRRADIWSFGVVLWEMLTGKQLFQGETVSDIIAAVLKMSQTSVKFRRRFDLCFAAAWRKIQRSVCAISAVSSFY